METELWPCLIHGIKRHGSQLILVNGRLSDKSVKRYQALCWLVSPMLAKFDLILVQSEDNRKRFEQLGASLANTINNGNLKFDIHANDSVLSKVAELKERQLSHKKLWVVGSTHPAEEALIFDAFATLNVQHPDLVLVIVPRHPERFDSVARLSEARSFNTIRRSEGTAINKDTQVWVVDTLGELLAFYAIADICTVAGSFCDVEGHNPLEPALFAKPIIVGPHMRNFKEMTDKLLHAGGIVQLDNQYALATEVSRLISHANQAHQLGKAAHGVILDNQGATLSTLTYLNKLMPE